MRAHADHTITYTVEIAQIKAGETVSRGKCLLCKYRLELVFQCVGAWQTMPATLALGCVQTRASLELSYQWAPDSLREPVSKTKQDKNQNED